MTGCTPSFQEVAETAAYLNTGDMLSGLWYAVEGLARGMERLEYNLAYQLALLGMRDHPSPAMKDGGTAIKTWEATLKQKTQAALLGLRSDLP